MYLIFVFFVETFGEILGVGIFAAVFAFLLGTAAAVFVPVGFSPLFFGFLVGIGTGVGWNVFSSVSLAA